MAKRLIIVWLSLTIVLFSSISIYADENVQGDFFIKNVIINGEEIVNYNLQYPIFLYNNTTYIPLTPEMSQIYGVVSEMDWESRTLKLLRGDEARKNISSNWLKNDNEDISAKVIPDAKVLAYSQVTSDNSGTAEIIMPELSIERIDLKGMPLLEKDGNIYIPLRALSESASFDWDVYFDPYYGICLSTSKDIPAETHYNATEASINKGLVGYMMHYNAGITATYGQELLFLFQRAAEVYNVDQKLLMAVAHKESSFTANAGGGGGAVGMMQVMPATGARYGLTDSQLRDAKTSINFGAMYISERIAAYNGDWTKGLSAYNQGSLSVNRGSHSTAYASRVMAAYNGINNYLSMNGYIL